MRYRGSTNNAVWILTTTRQRAVYHMTQLGVRETGIPVDPARQVPQRAICVIGDWIRQVRGYRWNDGDWVLADADDEELEEKLFQLQLIGAPVNPPLRWL